MKKIIIAAIVFSAMGISSCGSNSGSSSASADTTKVAPAGPDSSANNSVLPPSAAPGNANNSSLADTTYKAKDSIKK